MLGMPPRSGSATCDHAKVCLAFRYYSLYYIYTILYKITGIHLLSGYKPCVVFRDSPELHYCLVIMRHCHYTILLSFDMLDIYIAVKINYSSS